MATSAATRATRKRDWRPNFLKRLAVDGDVSASAEAAGLNRATAYKHYHKEPRFKAGWDEAIEKSLDRLEAELIRRGVIGWDEPVFYKGEQVATIRKFSDVLLLAKLNARGKARGYGRHDMKVSGDPDAPLHQTVLVTDRARQFGEQQQGGNGKRNGREVEDTTPVG